MYAYILDVSYVQKLNTNHKFLGYLNYLDYRIRGQEKARARAS